jgi:hypothetical protein
MKKVFTRFIAPLLMLVLSGTAFLGQLDSVLARMGTEWFQEQNESYLEETFDKALVGFGVMSGLKAGLAVVEGSTGGVSAGVSLNLQIGDVVQSAYDYVDIAWRTLLLGSICLLSIQYLLDAVSLLDSFVLGLFWFLMACTWVGRGRVKLLRDAFLLSTFAVLVVYLLLPVSILFSSQLSERITRPSIEAAQLGFQQTSQQLFPENKDLPEGFVARIKQIPERLEQITRYLGDRTAQMSLWTIQLIAGYLFDCILFPFGTFLLMIAGTRALLRYCYACDLHKALHTELRKLKA